MLQEGWNSKLLMLFITITSLFARIFVLLQNMNIEKLYRKEIDDLLQKRGSTVFHITGIRHCDYKDKADAFIEEAAKSMLKVSFLPEKANQYDHEAVSCRYGRKRIGRVATYDLEKYYILAEKNDTEQLTGHFGHFSANVEDHLLKLYMPGIVTMDEISDYRKKIDKQKDALYGSWKHDAIDHYLVHSRHQEDAIACISQLKENVVQLFGGHGTSTRKELTPILDDYKDCSQYDISLEGQRERWDILLYLDLLDDHNNLPGKFQDELLKDVEDLISQIGGELVRSVSYKSYIERLTELVTKHLPSSETAQHYLNALPPNAFDDIRKQVECFPHHLYHLFRTNPEEFVKTIYYARIPRKYLDPFLSGIALVEAYDKNKGATERTDITRGSTKAGEEELNYEAPKINLQHLLRQPWFSDARSEEKYDSKWTDAFVEALMGSEYGEGIARDWAWNIGGERNRHIQIKGYVVGLLVDAGVLKGSKRTIAKRIVEDQNDREMDEEDFWKEVSKLSRKMYTDTAGKQPYAQWVKGYVKENS